MIIKCMCKDPECKMEIRFNDEQLLFTDKRGNINGMYLDANTIHLLVKALRETLIEMVFGK
jgi:hypothetical protein